MYDPYWSVQPPVVWIAFSLGKELTAFGILLLVVYGCILPALMQGVALSVVCTVPDAGYLLAGALANTLLFFAVSISMADGRPSRKTGFADYKRQTGMLLPIKK